MHPVNNANARRWRRWQVRELRPRTRVVARYATEHEAVSAAQTLSARSGYRALYSVAYLPSVAR